MSATAQPEAELAPRLAAQQLVQMPAQYAMPMQYGAQWAAPISPVVVAPQQLQQYQQLQMAQWGACQAQALPPIEAGKAFLTLPTCGAGYSAPGRAPGDLPSQQLGTMVLVPLSSLSPTVQQTL